MNLKGESDYFATFKIKARDSAPQMSLFTTSRRGKVIEFLNYTNPFSFQVNLV